MIFPSNFIFLTAQMQLQASEDWWAQQFFGLDQSQRFVILIITIGCLTGIVCTLVGCLTSVISSMHRAKLEAGMKREMLDRGMSADEIARVIESSQPRDFLERWAARTHSAGEK